MNYRLRMFFRMLWAPVIIGICILASIIVFPYYLILFRLSEFGTAVGDMAWGIALDMRYWTRGIIFGKRS